MQYVWHPPWQVVVTKVRQMAADAKLSMEQFIAMETTIQATWKSAGDALRIKFQAMPQVWGGAILGGCVGRPLVTWARVPYIPRAWVHITFQAMP